MKVFISADIEGTNGIAAWTEANKEKSGEYNYFAAKMTEEVAAVCGGINDADPSAEILVKDAHATARNIDHAKLPPNVRLNRGWGGAPASMVNCLDKSYDAVIFTGYHSPAYTAGNPLAHTINSSRIAAIRINGVIAGEFHINYYASLSLGVPVVMVCGDKYLTELAMAFDKDIVGVATLEGYGNSTTNDHPSHILAELRQGAKAAAARVPAMKAAVSGKLPKAFDIEITYKRGHDAYRASHFPGMRYIDDMTVGFKCESFLDFTRAWMFI